jgi:hypothetical protein
VEKGLEKIWRGITRKVRRFTRYDEGKGKRESKMKGEMMGKKRKEFGVGVKVSENLAIKRWVR